MKISEKTRFPHPVLSEDTRDFTSGYLEIEFGVKEDNVTGSLCLTPMINLEHKFFKDAVFEGKIKIMADIRGRGTYYNELIELTHMKELEFEPGILSGRVVIRPFMVVSEDIDDDSPEDLDQEFELHRLRYREGELAGWSHEHVIHVGRKKLAPMESIFSLARNDQLEEGIIAVDPEMPKIQISAASKTYEHIDQMRKQADTQAIVLNAIYMPAIMQVLDSLRTEDFSDFDWFEVFSAKCDIYNINLKNTEPLRDSQVLLKSPYIRLQEAFNDSF